MKLTSYLLCLLFACLVWTKQQLEDRALLYDADFDRGKHGSYPVQNFVSSSITAPRINFRQWSPECDDDRHYLLTPRGWKVTNPGPMVLDSHGDLIWSKHFKNDFGGQAYDLKVQNYRGENYLTFWLGDDRIRGHGAGHFYMLNASYDVVRTIGAANNKFADLHDLIITPGDTAILIGFEVIQFDVRPAGRKFGDVWNQAIWDCVFQEIDVETGELLFEWRASDQVNITKTYNKLRTSNDGTQASPFDPFHLNSVEKDALGNYIVSARNLHSIMYVDGKSGGLIWTLGGKSNMFMDLDNGHALNFAWQHDARIVSPLSLPKSYQPPRPRPGMTIRLISMFDNAALDWDYSYGSPYSRGTLLELSYPTPGSAGDIHEAGVSARIPNEFSTAFSQAPLSKQDEEKVAAINGSNSAYTVRVVQEFVNPLKIRSSIQGSMQLVPNGAFVEPSFLLGYGLNAAVSQFSSNGSVLCDMHYGATTSWEKGDVQSYRAFKQRWIGRPRVPPDLALKGDKAFISWNGATEVHSWLLQSAGSIMSEQWNDVSKSPRDGFETMFVLPERRNAGQYFRAVALDASDRMLEHGVGQAVGRRYIDALVMRTGTSDFWMSYQPVASAIGSIAGLLFLYRLLLRYLSSRRRR